MSKTKTKTKEPFEPEEIAPATPEELEYWLTSESWTDWDDPEMDLDTKDKPKSKSKGKSKH